MESTSQINYLKAEIAKLKHLNAKLQRNDSEYSYLTKLYDNAQVGMVICDLKGKFLSVNNYFCNFLGYSNDELLKMSFKDIIHPDSVDIDIQNIKKLLSGELILYEAEKQYIKKDRRIVWGCLSLQIINDTNNNPDFFIATINDISANVKLRSDLEINKHNNHQNLKLLNAVLDGIPDIIGIQDTHHNIIKYNKAGYKYLNKKPEEVIGKKCYNLIGKKKRCDICSTYDCYLSKKPEQHEQFFPELGSWLDMRSYPILDDNNNVKFVVEHLRDITEQKIAKAELEHAIKKWENIFDAIGQPAMILNANQEIIKVNKKVLEISQNHETELLGKKCYDVFHGDISCKPEGCPYQKMLETKKSTVAEMPFELLGGYYIVSTTPVYDKQGNLDYVIHIATEITQRRNAEQKNREHEKLLEQKNLKYIALNKELKNANKELVLAKEKAEESDKLKTSFLHNMSHEIRTPLNAIIGFSGLLCQKNITPEKQNSFSAIIENSGTQLLSIVNDILTISSIETAQEKVNLENTCINDVILSLASIFKPQAQNQNISLFTKMKLNDLQAEIYTDKTKLTQILTNLISNALKFTHKGYIEFGYDLNNGELEFFCKDTGIGIDNNVKDAIFDRFRQADLSISRTYGGTGLGLSISKAFVELLGGKIWVESELKKGSIFRFTLPYKPFINNGSQSNKSDIKKSRATILIAEDEEFNFLFLEELLVNMDLEVVHAKNGKEAVDFCKSNNDIDLVLMDIKMPVMDGFEATKIIKKNNPTIPVIAQSAYAIKDEIEKYSDVFNYYITKPIKVAELEQKIKAIFKNRK